MLEVRLNKRIDQMVQRGLLQELVTLHALCKQQSDVLSHGIFQAIGTPSHLFTQQSRLQGIHSLSGIGRRNQRHSTGTQHTRPMSREVEKQNAQLYQKAINMDQ